MIKIRIHQSSSEEQINFDKVEKAFNFALDRFSHSIKELEVILSDLNGPKGGIDKTCNAKLILKSGETLVAKAVSDDYLYAVNECSTKLKSFIVKKKDKALKVKARVKISDLIQSPLLKA